MLEIENLHVSTGGTEILRGLSLKIDAGAWLSVARKS